MRVLLLHITKLPKIMCSPNLREIVAQQRLGFRTDSIIIFCFIFIIFRNSYIEHFYDTKKLRKNPHLYPFPNKKRTAWICKRGEPIVHSELPQCIYALIHRHGVFYAAQQCIRAQRKVNIFPASVSSDSFPSLCTNLHPWVSSLFTCIVYNDFNIGLYMYCCTYSTMYAFTFWYT